MRILLDAHAIIWAVDNPLQLGPAAVPAIRDLSNEIWIGSGSIWEIAIKVGLGMLSLAMPYRQWMEKAVFDLGASILPITIAHADRQVMLPNLRRDPFDRLLIAQSQVESASIASADAVFDQYGVSRLW